MQTASAAFKTMVEGNDLVVEQRVQITLPITRMNLIPNPNFERDASGWVGFAGTTFIISAAQHHSGTQSLRITWPTGAANASPIYVLTLPTKPGTAYVLSAWVWVVAGPTVVIGPNGTLLGSVLSAPSTVTGAWQRLSVLFTAADWLTTIYLWPTGATTAGQQVYVDDWLLEPDATVVGANFDGDSPGGRWMGIAGASPSMLNVDPYPDVTLAVESCTVDRQLVTDMPAATRQIAGYPAASATVVLSGMVDPTDETKDAYWLFNIADPTSPMYRLDPEGSPVTVDEGMVLLGAAELIRTFTGYIDQLVLDPHARTVTMTCLDNRTKLRSVPTLPAVASRMDVYDLVMTGLLSTAPGLTAGWVLDALLRANGINPSPPPRPQCVFFASLSGSAYPTVYSKSLPQQPEIFAVPYGAAMTFVPGKFSEEAVSALHLYAGLTVALDMTVAAGGFFTEQWVNFPASPNKLDGWDIQVYVPASFPFVTVYRVNADSNQDYLEAVIQWSGTSWLTAGGWRGTSTPATTVTPAPGWRQVTASWVAVTATTARYRLWIDGVLVADSTITVASLPANFTPTTVQLGSPFPVEAVQVTNEHAGLPASAFIPAAFLDPSLNSLVATLDLSGQDPWTVIQGIAAAEGAVAGFDEYGVFRFLNRNTLASGAAARAVSSASSLKGLALERGLSTVANHVTAKVNTIGHSTFQQVWSTTALYGLTPRMTFSFLATTSAPIISLSTICQVIPGGGILPSQPSSGYRAARKMDGTGGAVTNLVMTVAQLSPTTVAVSIYNPNPYSVYLVSPTGVGYPAASDGKPSVGLGGEFVTAVGVALDGTATVGGVTYADSQWPPLAEGGAVSGPRGELALQLPDNPWRQVLGDVQAFTDDTLADLFEPRPILTNLAIVADPRLQLGDRVTITDEASGLNDDAALTGITTASAAGAWDQAVTARLVSVPGLWIMGRAGRSEVGVTTYT